MPYRDSRVARERQRAERKKLSRAKRAFRHKIRQERRKAFRVSVNRFFQKLFGLAQRDEHQEELRRIRKHLRGRQRAKRLAFWRSLLRFEFRFQKTQQKAIARPAYNLLREEKPAPPEFTGARLSEKERNRLEAIRLKKLRKSQRKKSRSLMRKQLREKWLRFFHLLPPTPEQAERTRLKSILRARKREERKRAWQQWIRRPFLGAGQSNENALAARKILQRIRQERRRENWRWLFEFRKSSRELLRQPGLREKYLKAVLSSIVWYVLAFAIVYFIYQAITVLIAYSFGIPVIWDYSRLLWPLPDWSPFWTRKALIVIFGSGPIIALLIAFLSIGLFFFFKREETAMSNVFWVWCIVHGMNMFFGSYLTGVVTRTEFIYASEWIFMNNQINTSELFLSILSVTVLLITGWQVTPLFLMSSGSVTLISPKYRFQFILGRVLIPWLVGVGVFLLYNTPKLFTPLILKTLTPFLILIPVFLSFNSARNREIHLLGIIRKQPFSNWYILATVLIIVAYRLLFANGIIIN